MVNMSYCRFQNTLLALRECKQHLQEMANGAEEALSRDEKGACVELAKEAISFLRDLLENEVDKDDLNIWAFTSHQSTDLIVGAVEYLCEASKVVEDDTDDWDAATKSYVPRK